MGRSPDSAAVRAAKESRSLALIERDTAAAKVEAARLNRRIEMGYDAVEPGAEDRRRTAKVQRTGEDGVLTARKARKAVALSRDLLRNYGAARAIDWQKRVNVVGTGPVMTLHIDDTDQAAEVQRYWQQWAKDCDALDDTPLAELLAQIISARGTSGGAIVAVDTFDRDDGRLLVWSADHLVTIDEKDWKNRRHAWRESRRVNGRMRQVPMSQERGLIRDHRGRIVAYAISPASPGCETAKWDDVLILPRETAKLLKMPLAIGQRLPVPEYLTMVAELEDCYEMRAAELQTAKKAAGRYAAIISESAEANADIDTARGTLTLENDPAEESTVAKENYEAVEELAGGYVDYYDPGDSVQLLDADRPNMDVAAFAHDGVEMSAASIGLSRAHARVRAESSYSAYRGELMMSWATFAVDQKWLERRLMDWLIGRVIGHAQRTLGLFTGLPAGWQAYVSWQWPRMPIVDPVKEHNADRQALKNGTRDFAHLIGPDWRERMDALAEQVDYIRALGLPLSIFETVAGAEVEDDDEKQTSEDA